MGLPRKELQAHATVVDGVEVPWWYGNMSQKYRDEYVKQVLAHRKAKDRRRTASPGWEALLPMEKRGLIFALHADGMTPAKVARHLSLSRAHVDQLIKVIWKRIYFRADARFGPRRA